ncbi:MAG: 4a-hydroxytetrahydrobiopterin dehydratase [Hydrogenovibrio sp.]
MNPRWKSKAKPASLEARFEFEDFSILRRFLDDLADQAERLEHHPNISFGRNHVSVIIYSQAESLQDVDYALADSIDAAFNGVMK